MPRKPDKPRPVQPLTEAVRAEILSSVCDPDAWRAVIAKAVEGAQAGNVADRAFLVEQGRLLAPALQRLAAGPQGPARPGEIDVEFLAEAVDAARRREPIAPSAPQQRPRRRPKR